MQIEIWSDVMCPFCYIGKRKFERALSKFEGKNEVIITWKSFQLSPNLTTEPTKNINEFLAEHKGISMEQAQRMHAQVTEFAATVGLTYDFDKVVVANSFDAHRFSHFAKQYGKQHDAEELLFRAYFTEGKNTASMEVLTELCVALGLDAIAFKKAMQEGDYVKEVRADMNEAYQLGIHAVPCFVFNRMYAVSGAQAEEVFLETFKKAVKE